MIQEQHDILARTILERFAGTSLGHCVRVDFLGLLEARELCGRLAEFGADLSLAACILSPAKGAVGTAGEFAITADQAIALRNRKQTRVCLFVPPDMVDAAFSSLANSFELLDGRDLHAHALRELVALLPTEGQHAWRAVRSRLSRPLNVSIDRELDYVGALHDLNRAGALDRAGTALWRVGLIADARTNFVEFLPKNRECVIKLTRPPRIHATTSDRLHALGADATTGAALTVFFRNRALHDIVAWSRALAEGEGPTLDQWVFPLEQRSNIDSVTVRSFIGSDGAVESYCRLRQPEGPGGSLRAPCGPKEKMIVKWVTEPPSPANLSRWRVEMTSSGGEPLDTLDFELPTLDIPSSRRSCTVKLDLEFEEPPDFGLCMRVSALDNAGNVLENDAGELVCAESDEFFLLGSDGGGDRPERQTRRTAPSIGFGRLQAATEERADSLVEAHAQWLGEGSNYFTLRLNERRILTVGTIGILAALQRQALAESRTGASFATTLNDLHPLAVRDFELRKLQELASDAWTGFWRAREAYFSRLKRSAPRDLVEVADWTPELAGAALRYAQSYRDLLDELVASRVPKVVLCDALAVDSVFIRLRSEAEPEETALVLLPTHPLRSAWFAGYTQLLRTWEAQVLQLPHRDRKAAIDLRSLNQLVPTNVPAFAFHADACSPFVFTQNLNFFYAVALPPETPDPTRRLQDLAAILGLSENVVENRARQVDRLAEYLRVYQTTHPYVDALETTLVNADDELFTSAVRRLLQPLEGSDELEESARSPFVFRVTSFVESERLADGQELDGIRQTQLEVMSGLQTDHLLPALQNTLHELSALEDQPLPDAHVAFVADLSRPQVLTTPETGEASGEVSSFALHGLIGRLIPTLKVVNGYPQWLHRLVVPSGARNDPHPSGPRYTDALIDLQATWQRAGSVAAGGAATDQLALGVALSPDQQRLLERLHASTDWVVTLDRFFALDYYDSPNDPHLSSAARKYLLDYVPEFGEGLGHRMMLTTSSRDEIRSLLTRAMDELGFAAVDQSVRQLLHYLKTVSGRLALQALGSTTGASAAVGLGVVTAWLQNKGRLSQAVLVPVDLHPNLFVPLEQRATTTGNRRCDLVLFALKRNIVEASFIEVKWRRGLMSYDSLAEDMAMQMEASAQAVRDRFFSEKRIDGQLHRAALANVLRFYFDRARRYRLFDEAAMPGFLDNLGRLERTRPEFRAIHEGYIVSLDETPRKPMTVGEARINILTAQDFEASTEFHVVPQRPDKDGAPPADEEAEDGRKGEQATRADDTTHVVSLPLGAETGERHPGETQSDGGGDVPEAARPETESSDEAPPATVTVPLGATPGGEPVAWQPSIKGSPHIFMIGIPGQGKSWTTMGLLARLARQRVPALVLDFHGQFSDPSSAFVRDARPVVLDAGAGLPLTPFECSPGAGHDDYKANAFAISEIFAYVAGLGDVQRDVVYMAVRQAYQRHGFGEDLGNEGTYPSMDEVLHAIEEGEQSRRVPNVSARLRPLLEMDLFRPPADPPNLLSLIKTGLVVDVHNLYVEAAQLAVGAFLLRKVYKDMFRWGVADRLRLAIVLDEAHRLAKDVTLPKLMKEGRKFGITVVVASQGLGDFHQDVLSNAGTKVVFRVNYPESRRIAGFIRARQGQELAQRIEQLAVGNAYVQTPEMPYGALVSMLPPE